MSAPFSKHSLAPLAGSVTEHVCAPAYSFELEAGAYPGIRLAFENPVNDYWQEKSIRFDRLDAQIPANGQQRFWIVWPPTAPSGTPLIVTTWHVPHASYARRLGDTAATPIAHVLYSDEFTMAAGVEFLGPFENLPWEPWSSDAVAFMAKGGRLVGHFGFDAPASTADVSLQIRAIAGGTWRTTDPRRAIGAPSTPTTVLGTVFDTPAPLGEFRFRIGAGIGTGVTAHVYLEARP